MSRKYTTTGGKPMKWNQKILLMSLIHEKNHVNLLWRVKCLHIIKQLIDFYLSRWRNWKTNKFARFFQLHNLVWVSSFDLQFGPICRLSFLLFIHFSTNHRRGNQIKDTNLNGNFWQTILSIKCHLRTWWPIANCIITFFFFFKEF